MIYWNALPLQDESIRVKCILNPLYKYALNKNLTHTLITRLKIVALSRQNMILSASGLQGSGKSFVMTFIADKQCQFAKKELNIDNWSFTITEMNKVVAKLDKGEQFGLDEQIHTSGYGSNIEKNILDNTEMTTRQDKLSFYFLAPKFVAHNYFYHIKTWEMGSEKEWNWNKSIESQWKYTKSMIFDDEYLPLGYIITGKCSNDDFLAKYEKKKDIFVTHVREMKGSGRSKYVIEKAFDILDDNEFLLQFSGCSTKRLKRLMTIVKLEGELMSIDELNMLIDYLDYIVSFDKGVMDRLKVLRPPEEKKRKGS